jgi:membrane protease YdiL (CAAX protease family)
MGHEPTDTRRLSPAAWVGLAFAMTFPSVMAALYFLVLGGGAKANPVQQLAYSAGKIVQFTFPLFFVFFADGRWPRLQGPRRHGLALGLGFGLLVAGAMLGLYFGWLADSALLASTPAMVQGKLWEFISSWEAYLGLATFIVLIHSLLEEYYWRWFVFDRLTPGLRPFPAAVLSSAAFMGHHVIILHVYFPGQFLSAVVPFSLGIAVGGMVWAWLFRRTGSLWATWLSHLLVDAAIFVIGWDLLTRAGGLG